ncbi:lef-11 [Erannis ankeraria nucleopolyhedrovirus]|uniref:lef-11 n=1 Tax=Erannis ankeraria nucleopolyhedrovirus TaxID=2913600 RepID=UPI00117B0D6F|nr:lef-11 [Erannis ankeraria nucleopolyhedrovirus]UJZ88975.1 lef-11 [Erannis ankeraria nucleopolyhedrovirus]
MDASTIQNNISHAARINENCEHCLTRSEVYALVRESINKRKHIGGYEGVCDHVNSIGFEAQIEYIRENLKTARIIVGDGYTQCKRLEPHLSRLNNIFNLNTDLQAEYSFCINKYNGGTSSNHD